MNITNSIKNLLRPKITRTPVFDSETSDYNIKENKLPKTKNKLKQTKRVFSRENIIAITKYDTDKPKVKEIETIIRNEAQQWLKTEDFYSGYFVDNGYLKYVVHKSNSYDAGKLSKLTPVLLNEGNYHLIDGDNCFKFTNKGDEIVDNIDYITYSEPNNNLTSVNLDTIQLDNDIPKTLYLQWSLGKRNFHINTALLIIFSISIACRLASSYAYEDLSQKAEAIKKQIEAQNNKANATITPDYSLPIKAIVKAIDGKGVVAQIKQENNLLMCYVNFNDENDARTFIKIYGGIYENSQVILATTATPNK